MNKVFAKSAFTIGLLAMLLAVPVYGAGVNKSVRVSDGGQSTGESSVNGSITVGADATVTGSLHTVNGKIRVGDRSSIENANTVNGSLALAGDVTAHNLGTVNGSITLGQKTVAEGSVEAVNGSIVLDHGSRVDRDVSNVNGGIRLQAALVGGDVSTVNGDVELTGASEVKGDIVVKKPGMGRSGEREPKIVIGPGSRVGGVIRLKRKVTLYISETAEVGGVEGVMSMNDAVRFTGERP